MWKVGGALTVNGREAGLTRRGGIKGGGKAESSSIPIHESKKLENPRGAPLSYSGRSFN